MAQTLEKHAGRNSEGLRSACPLVLTALTGKLSVFSAFLMKDITHRINYPNVFLLSGVLLSDITHASLVQCIKYSAGKCYWEGKGCVLSLGLISCALSTSLGTLHGSHDNTGPDSIVNQSCQSLRKLLPAQVQGSCSAFGERTTLIPSKDLAKGMIITVCVE